MLITAFSTATSQTTLNIATTFTTDVYGNSDDGSGLNYSGDPNNRTVNVLAGGAATAYLFAAFTEDDGPQHAAQNTVNIMAGGTANSVFGARTVSYDNSASTLNNTVRLEAGGIVTYSITGGSTRSLDSGTTAVATNNMVYISGEVTDEMGGVGGGFAVSEDGTATATNNSVIVNPGGYIGGMVYGGVAQTEPLAAIASNNIVTIFGGTVDGNIIGGMAKSDSRATANNNTVNIHGGTFGPSTTLAGGELYSDGNAFSGNTLNLHAPIAVAAVTNFENLHFHLPAGTTASATLLSLATPTDLSNTIINVTIDGPAPSLAIGAVITLIDNVINTPTNNGAIFSPSGYTLQTSISGGALIATVTGYTSSNDVGQPQAGDLKAYIQNGVLRVGGLAAGASWSVYDLAGVRVGRGVADGGEAEIALSVRGVYLVVSDGKSVKIVY
jgi:hypothetical protein